MENYKFLCASRTELNSVQVSRLRDGARSNGQDTNETAFLSLPFARKHSKPRADVEKNEWQNFLLGNFVLE